MADKNKTTEETPEVPPLVKPSLTQEDLAAVWPEKSKGLDQLDKQYSRAKVALDQANAAELFTLYESSVREQAKLMLLFKSTVETYAGSSDPKKQQEEASASAVAAMERVALAAIELAKSIAVGKGK